MANEVNIGKLLEQPIPVLSNRLILKFMEAGLIKIDNFDAEMLGPTSYRIRPKNVRYHREDDDGIILADGEISLGSDRDFSVGPGEYVVFGPKEAIFIGEGIVADFYPSSWCVERNLNVTAGRLDADYHHALVFGLFNGGRADVTLKHVTQLLRVTFSWLGRENIPDYSGKSAGAYIERLDQLREVDADYAKLAREIEERRSQLAALLEGRSQ